MPRFKSFVPQGVIPAALMAFDDDFAIDEPNARKHLKDLAAVDGIAAITTNAHASEVATCTLEEQRRILDFTMDEVGDRLPVVHGVYADGSHIAADIARMAERGGSSALLVFPPNTLAMGGQLRPEMALAHFKAVADATEEAILNSLLRATTVRSASGEAVALPVEELRSLLAAGPR